MAEIRDDDQLILTHLGDEYHKYFGAVVPPIFMNTFHVFDEVDDYRDDRRFDEDVYIYGRLSNPTVKLVEDKIAALERGSQALCFGSGMAAATAAVLSVCKSKSHIICVKNCYGVVKSFIDTYCIPKMDMRVSYVSGKYIQEFEDTIRPETDLIILESPSSSIFEIQDLRGIAQLARKYGIKTYIDNSFCTPLFQKPLELGIDIVMHTASKYLGGHSDLLGGVLVFKDEEFYQKVACKMREMIGSIIGPMEAWLMMRGLRSLDVRVERHAKSALEIAKYLENHPKIKRVYYTGLESHPQYDLLKTQQIGSTGLLSFTLASNSMDEAKKVANNLKHFKIGPSWGGYESLVTVMYANAAQEVRDWHGIENGSLRIHCGLEGVHNLLEDLEQSLKRL